MARTRQVVLDTETTGLEPSQGHRVIEIGCVELIDRRMTDNRLHHYLQPDREIDAGAVEVHGITTEFLADKPRFADVAGEFIEFIRGAELIIHNAPFDVGFLNHELSMLSAGHGELEDHCTVLDTLAFARQLHPGQRNSLDALCRRYNIDNSQRDLHGALLDAEILADVYLVMTGGQASLSLDSHQPGIVQVTQAPRQLDKQRPRLRVVAASEDEIRLHQDRLEVIDKESDGKCVWKQMEKI